MSSALRSTPEPPDEARASFAVDRLVARDGTLLVEGRWSGVRGMRFLRPTLVVDGRQVLATLEHKPWAPAAGSRWVAAFPWDGDDEALTRASMEVAPSVIVPLGPDADAAADAEPGRLRPPVAAPTPAAIRAARAAEAPEFDPGPPARTVAPAAESVLAPVPDAHDAGAPDAPPGDATLPEFAPATALTPEQADARRELRAVERERDEHARAARSAAAERDRALARVEEAVRDREAAIRTRDRMDAQLVEAQAAQARAEQEREEGIAAARRDRDERVSALERDRDERIARLEADRDRRVARLEQERDEAARERDQVRGQRDDALLAGPALRRPPASAMPATDGGTAKPGPRTERSAPPGPDEDDAPLGIRSVPAARAAGLRTQQQRRELGRFDVWTLRVLAVATATCFLILLFSLVRLFV